MSIEERIEQILQESQDWFQRLSDIEGRGVEAVSYDVPKALSFFLLQRQKLVKALRVLEEKRRKLYLSLWKYYMGISNEIDRQPFKIRIMKGDVKSFIEADDEYLMLERDVKAVESALSMLDEYIDFTKKMQYLLKLVVDNKRVEGL